MIINEDNLKSYICDKLCQFPLECNQEELELKCEKCMVDKVGFIVYNDGGKKFEDFS